MDRRTFLASWLAGSVGLTAGCGALAESRQPVTLQERATETTADDTEKRVRYGTADRVLLAMTLGQPIPRASVTDEFQLDIGLAARRDLQAAPGDARLTRLRYRLRAPRAAARTPASIYVAPPSTGGRPAVETRRTRAGRTELSVAAAALPVVVSTRVDPAGAEVDRVRVWLDSRLETADHEYALAARTSYRPAVAPGVEPAPSRGGGRSP